LPSALFLGLAALAALLLARRVSPPDKSAERAAATRALLVAVAAQALHVLEEASTGFHRRFGPLFGVEGMPFWLFVAVNVAWITVWLAASRELRQVRAWAFFAAWFLAIAGTLNGVAHPVLATVVGGYFPGLISSPVVGAASLWLMTRLVRATSAAPTRR
jgi:hypothetical protein